ncbi:MAG: hypothetical protein C0511_07535 [Hyphomicrobium sp.]|nr:hypothetical protein [Hyphomicrobium sp.]
MRRIVFSHFFNEAYLLPWWLEHHREIFEHGVLIDYASTDESVAICRELVPSWEIIRSENHNFAAVMADFEVMKHEQRFSDCWKIALNTTEFLIASNLAQAEQLILANNLTGMRLPGAIMIDPDPTAEPDYKRPLVTQKASGVFESAFDFNAMRIPGLSFPTRNRLYHRYAIGAYTPGRHGTHLPGIVDGTPDFGAVWWYAFSPWTAAFRARKLGIAPRRDPFDKRYGFGVQHEANGAELNLRWAKLVTQSKPLTFV